MEVKIRGLDSFTKDILEKLFYDDSEYNCDEKFLLAIQKCNKGEIDKIESKPIEVINFKYKIAFEHDSTVQYASMRCWLKLYMDDGEGYKCIYTDKKPSYININWKGEKIIEIRLKPFLRKCLTIMFKCEHTAYRTIISLDFFCDWVMQYLFKKHDAIDLATFLFQKIQEKNMDAFNYCLENSKNIARI